MRRAVVLGCTAVHGIGNGRSDLMTQYIMVAAVLQKMGKGKGCLTWGMLKRMAVAREDAEPIVYCTAS